MDLQMPEMDGVEATRELIRRWPSRHPRVVALTADVLQEEREACLAAGMDDFLTKQIRIAELVRALRACPPRASGGRAPEQAGSEGPTPDQ